MNITLKDYDTAVATLLKQGKCGIEYDDDIYLTCLYRHNGKACFAGQFIPDDKYISEVEHNPVEDVCELINMDWDVEDLRLLSFGQTIHDELKVKNWKESYAMLREKHFFGGIDV